MVKNTTVYRQFNQLFAEFMMMDFLCVHVSQKNQIIQDAHVPLMYALVQDVWRSPVRAAQACHVQESAKSRSLRCFGYRAGPLKLPDVLRQLVDCDLNQPKRFQV